MFGSDKFRFRIARACELLKVFPLRSIANDDEARLPFEFSTGFQQVIDPLARLKSPYEKNHEMVCGRWSMVWGRSRCGRDRVMRDEDLLTRETKRGILVRAALTVRDQCIELFDKGIPNFSLAPSQPSPKFCEFGGGPGWGRRTQPPANDRLTARLHPSHRRRGRQVARVGFHDQSVRIPIPEPVDQSMLITKVEPAAQEMNVF